MKKNLFGQKTLSIVCIVGLIAVVIMSFMSYQYFKGIIINIEKQKVSTTAQTAAVSLRTFIVDVQKQMDLFFSPSQISETEEMNFLTQQYKSISGSTYSTTCFLKNPRNVEKYRPQSRIISCELDDSGEHYTLVIGKTIMRKGEIVGYIEEQLNLNLVYDMLLRDVRIGKRGYCTLKDENGYIIMHSTKSQIGVDSNSQRKKDYPDLNPLDVDRLLNSQYSGEVGCEIVTSYWWDHPSSGKVKKLIGYAPVRFEDHMFVLNVITAYADVAQPVFKYMINLAILGVFVVVLVGTSIVHIIVQNRNLRHLKHELKYIKQLQQADAKLEQQEEKIQKYDKLQTLGVLVGTIAHEYNNMITPIILYSDMLIDELREDELLKEEVEEIRSSATRCAELSKQILQYSRQGNEENAWEPYDLCTAVATSSKMIKKFLPDVIKMKTETPPHPLVIYGSVNSINQILLNLCTNAVYAMKPSGGTLTVTLTKKASKAILMVTDTGCGMDSDTVNHIFESFYTTKPENEGTGLGLSVVKRLVTQQKGQIRVDSVLGKGTTFVITLPILTPSNEQICTEPKIKSEKIKHRKLKVIVVDDNPTILGALRVGLQKTSWEVEFFESSLEAIEKMKVCPNYDLVITDMDMPEISGEDIAVFAKKMNTKAKVMAITGYTEADMESKKKTGIMDAYIYKPLSLENIFQQCTLFFD